MGNEIPSQQQLVQQISSLQQQKKVYLPQVSLQTQSKVRSLIDRQHIRQFLPPNRFWIQKCLAVNNSNRINWLMKDIIYFVQFYDKIDAYQLMIEALPDALSSNMESTQFFELF